MPFTGGYAPSPERGGGGDGAQGRPLLQRVVESIGRRRGPGYDQTLNSAVGAENMAFARAITFDLFAANRGFANEMNPQTATLLGNLTRWEAILAQPPLPTDSESNRQARCAAALARFAQTNDTQSVKDVLKGVLGRLFVDLVLPSPSNSNVWWPGLAGAGAGTFSFLSPNLTVTGLANVPPAAPGAFLTLGNATSPGNDGTFQISHRVSSTSVVVSNVNGVGGDSGGAGGLTWSISNPGSPWTSGVAHVGVLVDPRTVPGLLNVDGTLAPKFFALVNAINPVLDYMLPADCTFDWIVYGQGFTSLGFYLDDPNNLDCEAFEA